MFKALGLRQGGCFLKRFCFAFVIAIAISGNVLAQAKQQYYTGDGGKGIRLAVLEPTGKGLSENEQWMLSLVQGSITGDFNKFSSITVIDRQNLEKIFAEWKEGFSGHYSAENRIKIGNLTNASHILTGSISKTATAFMLELIITDVASGERKASYAPTPVSPIALENLSVVKEASADLLKQLGVNLTSEGLGELKRVATTTRIQAETALARGILAQRQGTEVAALSYFFQAAALDSSLFEASTRSKVMAANISSGNIGADVRNDIVWRKSWVARLTETEQTFHTIINTADPPYTLFYSTGIETGNINYKTETANLSIPINLGANVSWFNAMNRSLQTAKAVLDGLNKTNRKDDWELSDWPREGVSKTNPFAHSKQYDITVVFELVNEQGRTIGSQTVKLNPSFGIKSDFTIGYTENTSSTVNFGAVKADDISDNLTIRIASVNGEPPQNARFAITAVQLIDVRNGRKYNSVIIDNKTWMAENLNYETGNSWCYNNDESNCSKYGRLYDWNTALKACPAGWHLPTNKEWDNMVNAVGGKDVAGKKLKSQTGWREDKKNVGNNDYGFSALPGGYRNSGGNFNYAGDFGYWWSATENGAGYARNRGMFYGYSHVGEGWNYESNGQSVRCLRD